VVLPQKVREFLKILRGYKEKGLKSGSFSEDEVARFKHALAIYGKEDMDKVAEYVGNRNALQCRGLLALLNYKNKL
jgi:hypothetical protein